MEGPAAIAKFVSQKISRVRWQPTHRQAIESSKVFVTGSWDNEDENKVCLWQLDNSGSTSFDEDDRPNLDGEPSLLCEKLHDGDVTDLIFLNQENIFVSSSRGSASIFRYHPNSQTLSESCRWERLHYYTKESSPCTGIAAKGDETLVSVGEDGRINVLNMDHRKPTRTIEKADSCTINAVTFLRQSEIATVNTIGQLKVWDLRQASDQPARTFLLTGERVPLHCLDKHPTQPHIVATGGQDGTLSIWDMRQDKFPVTLLSAHSADMWEVRFHASHPDNLFSCSQEGSVWHWDRSSMSAPSAAISAQKDGTASKGVSLSQTLGLTGSTPEGGGGQGSRRPPTSAWLSGEASTSGLDITDLLPGNTLPVSTLDITDNTLLCGTDGEQVYSIRNLVIK